MQNQQKIPFVPEGLVEALHERFLSNYPQVSASQAEFIAHAAYREVIDQLQGWKYLSEKKANV